MSKYNKIKETVLLKMWFLIQKYKIKNSSK